LQWGDSSIWGNQLPNAGYIHLLAIKNDLHGQGLGQQMIDWAATQVASHNRQFLRLNCSPDNLQLCNYYEQQGFAQIRLKKVPTKQNRYITALYERSVTQ
jgi:ribosomal protein S18 acetylase RimI-like enzyme